MRNPSMVLSILVALSAAVSMKLYEPVPLMVPSPLNCALNPDTTSHWCTVLLNLRLATVKLNSVFPVGILAPVWYREIKPNVASPTSVGSAAYAPDGDAIVPTPVTYPALGSYTTTYWNVSVAMR